MNRKTLVLLILMAVLAAPLIVRGQETTPVCLDFGGGSQSERVAYYMGEGFAYVDSRLFERSLQSFSCVINEIDPSYPEAYLNRGLSYAALRLYPEAIADFDRAIDRRSGFAAAYNNRGIVYAAQGQYDTAIEDFNQVLELNANSITGYNNRGVIYAAQGEYDLAIADFERAIELDEDYAQPYALLGIVYSAQALDNYNQYLALTGDQADRRIQGVANSLASRFTYELRFDDGTWLLTADIEPDSE